MPAFKYTAYSLDGREKRGVVEADSARAARAKLREQGLTASEVDAVQDESAAQTAAANDPNGNSVSRQAATLLQRRLSSEAVSRITRSIASLTEAGLPIDEALAAVIDQAESDRERQVAAGLRGDVLAGNSLAGALGRYPASFDELYRTLVAAGESAGRLPQVLNELANHLENRASQSAKLAVALIYPLIVLAVAATVLAGMIAYVLPNIAQTFADSKAALPWLTRMMLGLSALLKNVGWVIPVLLLVGFFIARNALQYPATRRRWHQTLLRLPIAGPLAQKLDTARLASTLAMLTASGVPLSGALKSAAGVLRMVPLREALETVRYQVEGGQTLARALSATGQFPAVLIRLIGSGETTGKLADALARAAKESTAQANARLAALTALFEPAITVLVGIAVLLIVLAVLLPIFELNRLIAR